MKSLLIVIISFLSCQFINAQELSGKDLLDKAINYHDPEGRWSKFDGEFYITMETPNNPNRDSHIKINLPKEFFYVSAKRDTTTTEYTIAKTDCTIKLNGESAISEAQKKEHNLSCDRAKLYKNYYTYLYGLPMKLKDEGTIIHDKVERKTFKGKEYLVLKASYDETVGSDVWFFYFDPKTYAMEVYQFFKTDDKGALKKDSGEYILLTDTSSINGIKIPKLRAWYYNKDNKYLGTDKLTN
ncbi:DUF6503 family protein [uncultured Psychroserpens sp.]|uniref:DUF6503 family protein n=1 Tax=uncultured Psychroserpens sp. TaxID=255436 RepID=UPI002628D329|nr:DUF6503 family protein [uncultured Psychroserpens sp.]